MPASPMPAARPFTVVVGVDFSPSSDRALATARTLCKLSGRGQLHVVHAVSLVALSSGIAEAPIVASQVEAELVAAARTRLSASVPLPEGSPWSEVTVHVETGIAHDILTAVARDCGADLVVVGTRGLRGLERVFTSSVSERVARDAPCSVLTVRPREITAEETVEAGCPECIAATAANGAIYTRCSRHQERRVHAHTYTDLGDAMRAPTDAFSF